MIKTLKNSHSAWNNRLNLLIISLLLVLVCYTGLIIPQIVNNFSIGRIAKFSIPTFCLVGTIFLLRTVNLRDLFKINIRSVRWGKIIPLIIITFGLGFVLNNISITSLTYLFVGMLVVIGMTLAMFLSLNFENLNGIIIFLLCMPFLAWLEWVFQDTWIGGGTWGFITVSPTIILLWMFTLLTIIKCINKGKKISGGSLFPYILAWGILLFISSMVSINPKVSFQKFTSEVFVFPLFYFLVVNFVHSDRDRKLITWTILIYGVLRGAIVYYFYLIRTESEMWLALSDVYRSSLMYTGLISSISAWIIPLGLALLMIEDKKLKRVFLLASIIFAVYLLFGSGGRGKLIAIVFTSPVFLFIIMKRKNLLSISVVMSFFILLILLTPTGKFIIDRFLEWESWDLRAIINAQAVRVDCWQAAIKMMWDYPISGIGLGMWSDYYPFYSMQVFWVTPVYAHHLFLKYGVAGGIGVFMVLIILLIKPIVKGVRGIFSKGLWENDKIINSGLIWGLSTFIVSGIFGSGGSFATVPLESSDQIFISLDMGMYPWVVMGLLVSLSNNNKDYS